MKSSGNWRGIVDCSTFLSGIFYPLGKPNKILSLWVQRNFDLYLSQAIYQEYQDKTKDIAIRLKKTGNEGILWFKLLDKRAIFVEPKLIPKESCRDSGDLKYLEAAKGGNADFLVTSDKDLLVLKKFDQTKILSPSEFLEIFVKNLG